MVVQLVPSQNSFSVDGSNPAMVMVPTATQKVLERHVTPLNCADCVPAGSALAATIDHADPFHCSTSVVGVDPSVLPTATQNEGPAQETPWSTAGPSGSGPLTGAHDDPFPCSRSGLGGNPCRPTATQKEDVGHATPLRLSVSGWEDVGVLTAVQVDGVTVGGTVVEALAGGAVLQRPSTPAPIATTHDRSNADTMRRMFTLRSSL